MPKNIVLLSDGTGNSNVKDRGTNVFKLYEAIDYNGLSSNPQEQEAFYDDGVGTQNFKPLKILGNFFGWGLARNVKNLYKRLAQVYEPGDKIYLFGFSRGAFTVRSLAGLIASKGILDMACYPSDEELELAVLQLYENYRSQHAAVLEKMFYQPLMQFFFKPYSAAHAVHGGGGAEIEFIGVWDTVDAVGLPFDEATRFWNTFVFRFKFSDYVLNPLVKKACQALSIDDERQTFHPLVWNVQADDDRVEQVWFPGVHANVGGGYPQQGLSLVAMDWMMEKASAAGLQFVPRDVEFVRDKKYACDKLYDSRSGLAVYFRYLPRNIASISASKGIAKPHIHESVFHRISQGIFGYAPGSLPSQFEVVDKYGVHPNSAAIQALVSPAGAGGANHSPLLDDTAALIRLRRGIYYTFLAYSVFTLYWLLREDVRGKGFFGGLFAALKALVDPDGLMDKLAMLFWGNPWLGIGGLLIFGASVYVRNKMVKLFARFWSPLRAPLKSLAE